MTPPGPLFAGPPGTHGLPWLQALPVLAAVPAAAILLVGLVRGRLAPSAGLAGIVILPLVTYGLGGLLVLEASRAVAFCGSCHVMAPVVASLDAADGRFLAASHRARGAVSPAQACYVCHSGYGIWGTLDAKLAGLGHMLRTVTGRYRLPLALNAPFDIDSCLGCHAGTPRFRAVAAHQPLDIQQALVARRMGCTGLCHPPAHPPEALTGQGSA